MPATKETGKGLHVFDADGTLLEGSIVERAYWELIERKIFEPSEETIKDLQDLRTHPRDWKYIGPLVKSYAEQKRGKSVKTIERVAEEFAEIDAPRVYKEMQREITQRRVEEKAVLAMISGSPHVFVRALAMRLGFDIAVGSYIPTKAGVYHPHRPGQSKDRDKHIYASGIVRKLGVGAFVASAYGDTMSDLSVLEIAREPVAVNPTSRLREIALERRWRIIDCVQ